MVYTGWLVVLYIPSQCLGWGFSFLVFPAIKPAHIHIRSVESGNIHMEYIQQIILYEVNYCDNPVAVKEKKKKVSILRIYQSEDQVWESPHPPLCLWIDIQTRAQCLSLPLSLSLPTTLYRIQYQDRNLVRPEDEEVNQDDRKTAIGPSGQQPPQWAGKVRYHYREIPIQWTGAKSTACTYGV